MPPPEMALRRTAELMPPPEMALRRTAELMPPPEMALRRTAEHLPTRCGDTSALCRTSADGRNATSAHRRTPADTLRQCLGILPDACRCREHHSGAPPKAITASAATVCMLLPW
jgi:hypothetical protein